MSERAGRGPGPRGGRGAQIGDWGVVVKEQEVRVGGKRMQVTGRHSGVGVCSSGDDDATPPPPHNTTKIDAIRERN